MLSSSSQVSSWQEGWSSMDGVRVAYVAQHHPHAAHKPAIAVPAIHQPAIDQSTTYDLQKTSLLVLGIIAALLFLRWCWPRVGQQTRGFHRGQIVPGSGERNTSGSSIGTDLHRQRSEVVSWMPGIESVLGRYCQKPESGGIKSWILAAKEHGLEHWTAENMTKINHQRNRLVHDHTALSDKEWKEIHLKWTNVRRTFAL